MAGSHPRRVAQYSVFCRPRHNQSQRNRLCALAPTGQRRLSGSKSPDERLVKALNPLESPSDPEHESPELSPAMAHEPILTLPGALTAYVLLIAIIHLRVLLPPDLENWTVDVFGFIPKRYDSTLLNVDFPGGDGAKVWTFVTYSLLHANLTHIGFNVLWLLPFGSALARRFGAVRFFLFLAVTAAAGALAHLLTHEHAVAPMIGASASVSGAMAAAIRFAFVRGSFLSFSRTDADTAAKVPALDRKSTRLNSSHMSISYAVFCLKKKKKNNYKVNTTKKKKKLMTRPI